MREVPLATKITREGDTGQIAQAVLDTGTGSIGTVPMGTDSDEPDGRPDGDRAQ